MTGPKPGLCRRYSANFFWWGDIKSLNNVPNRPKIPDNLTAEEAAPLMCAGVTTYNSLRNSGALPGDTVAVLGLGGLGHPGVQYANKMGMRTMVAHLGSDL